MDIIRLSTDWAKAEVFSAKMLTLLSVVFFLVAFGFWQLGKTVMAKATHAVLNLLISQVAFTYIDVPLTQQAFQCALKLGYPS